MPGPNPQNDYGTFGGVPSEKPSETGGATPYSVRATGADFGAQVGEAKTQFGGQVEKLGQVSNELAMKYQGIVNETSATNAETDLISKYAAARADLMSSTGNEALQKQPAYLKMLNEQFQASRSSLPAGAQRMFDATGRRLLANYTSEGVTYGVSQGKQAYKDSLLRNANIYADTMKDPLNANPEGINNAIAAGYHAHTSLLDEDMPGIDADKETGNFTFAATEEGRRTQAVLQANLENHTGTVVSTAVNTVANSDAMNASKLYDMYKDQLNPQWQATIAASLAPKVKNQYINSAVTSALTDLHQGYSKALVTPDSSAGVSPYNLGNVKTKEGAANNTAEFVHPATPVDGVIVAANNLKDNYQGLTLEQIGAKWAPSKENNTSDWVRNVSASSGISPDTVPNLSDPATMKKILAGIATAEKKPADRLAFSDDVMTQGVDAALSGQKANLSQPVEQKQLPGTPEQNYGKNADGTMLTSADYLATHREATLQKWRNWAATVKPGDSAFENEVSSRINGQINQVISDQKNIYHQDLSNVMDGVLGKLTDGKPPSTMEELYAIPQVKSVLDQLPTRDKESQDFYKNLPDMISKYQKRNTVTNSAGSYDAAIRALMPYDTDHPNGIFKQSDLDKMLGSTDPDSINGKDYEDIKPIVGMSHISTDPWKELVSHHMQAISSAGGDIDGRGKQRAMNFFNMMVKIKTSQKSDDTKSSVVTPEDKNFIEQTANSLMVSRAQQVANAAREKRHEKPWPQKGEVVRGYVSNGQDPSNRENWSRVQQ